MKIMQVHNYYQQACGEGLRFTQNNKQKIKEYRISKGRGTLVGDV